MTITNSTRLVTYTGNGVTTEFDYTFLIPTGALVVTLYEIATGVEGDPLSDALYSVTGLDDPAGGTVTYPLVGSPLAATHKINVKRDVAATQDLNLTNQSPYFPEELEEQLDRIVMMIQQNEEAIGRAVVVVSGSGTDPADLIADLTAASAAAVASAAAAAVDAAAADVDATAAAASAVAAAASAASAAAALATKVSKSGDTMTGSLTIALAYPSIILNKPASGTSNQLVGRMNGGNRWLLELGASDPESGANAGSSFILNKYDDAGAFIHQVLSVSRTVDALSLDRGQLKFPATQNASSDANTLDDYEEGTFTPTIIGTGTAGAGTYSVQVGRYTKCGDRVHGEVELVWSAHTGTTNMKISGLPFTQGARKSVVALSMSALTMAAALHGYVEASATTVALLTSATGAAEAALPIDGAATLRASFNYSIN